MNVKGCHIVIAPKLQTDRLFIQRLEIKDAGVFFQYRSDERVFKYQSWQPTEKAEAEAFILKYAHGDFGVPDTWYQMGLYLQQTSQLIGDIGLHFLDVPSQSVEIGFTVAPAYQRQGYAFEAVREMLNYLLETLEKHRVIASVDPRNTASIALLEKLGMRKEAHFRESLKVRGEWVDDVIYAILRNEWKL